MSRKLGLLVVSLFVIVLSGCGESEEKKQFHKQLVEKALNDEVKKQGVAFLKENSTKQGVVVTRSGLQYEVVQSGNGEKPSITDSVRVDYTGWRVDGELFESSAERTEKPVFPVKGVIKGWCEALLMMSPGAKWKIYLPSELAYGATSPNVMIPANSALVFEVELLEVLSDQGIE